MQLWWPVFLCLCVYTLNSTLYSLQGYTQRYYSTKLQYSLDSTGPWPTRFLTNFFSSQEHVELRDYCKCNNNLYSVCTMYNFLCTQVIKCAVGQYYIHLAYLLSIPRLYPFFGLLKFIPRGGYNRGPTVIIIIININNNYNIDKYLQCSFLRLLTLPSVCSKKHCITHAYIRNFLAPKTPAIQHL